MSVLVLAAHGSRDPRFDVTARRVADAVRVALPGVRVELAYLDLTAPLLDDVLAGVTGDVTVVPLLFGNGFHGKVDLPEIIARAEALDPNLSVRRTDVVGVHSPVPALVDRLHEAGLTGGDGVLMIAVGSSDAGSDRSIAARADELSAALGRSVRLVFATRIGRDGALVREAVAALRADGATRVVVSPLFLSAGLLTDRVESVVDRLDVDTAVAGPIGAHPSLVASIVALYAPTPAAPLCRSQLTSVG